MAKLGKADVERLIEGLMDEVGKGLLGLSLNQFTRQLNFKAGQDLAPWKATIKELVVKVSEWSGSSLKLKQSQQSKTKFVCTYVT